MKLPILISCLLGASINCMHSELFEVGCTKTAVKLLKNNHDYINPEHDRCVDQLLTAIVQGNKKRLKKVLHDNPNQSVNICITMEGQYPIHLAALQMRNGVDIIKILLTRNTDINCVDNEGRTPLASAAAADNTKAIKLLLQEGAKRFWENDQENPYYHALRNGSIEAIKLLISLNIRVSEREIDLANAAITHYQTKPPNSCFYALKVNAELAKTLFEDKIRKDKKEEKAQKTKYIKLESDDSKLYFPWHRNIFKRP